MKKSIIASTTLVLATLASSAFANVVKQDGVNLVGSDTLDGVFNALYADLAIVVGEEMGTDLAIRHEGLGSSSGERQLEGEPNSDEPSCTGSTANTMGCQEIAGMSRPVNDGSICDEPDSANAEGLKLCKDAIVVITDNASHQQVQTAACAAVDNSTDNTSGPNTFTQDLTDSGNLGNAWATTLSLIYTGCLPGEDCRTDNRVARCSRQERVDLLANWDNMFTNAAGTAAGTKCSSNCTSGLRQAYRRDDNSGTTGVFLGLIGAETDSASFTGRTLTQTGFGNGVAAESQSHVFCDGGQFEGVFYDRDGAVGGDPIRKNCAAEDDICFNDGKMGVVRAIRSTPAANEIDPAIAFPTKQCTPGAFARATSIPVAVGALSESKVCPDGEASGTCIYPFYDVNGDRSVKDFNCINASYSRPGNQPGSFDGRVYNAFMHAADGSVIKVNNNLPEVAQWRQNMVQIQGSAFSGFGGPYAAGLEVCQETSATRNIGCIVGKTKCTFGYAGREAATSAGTVNNVPAHGETQEPLLVAASYDADLLDPANALYPLARDLYLNSVGGFENTYANCLAANVSVLTMDGNAIDADTTFDAEAYCMAQVLIASSWANAYDVTKAYCAANGFDEIVEQGGVDVRCEGVNKFYPANPACGEGNPITSGGITHQDIDACDPCTDPALSVAQQAACYDVAGLL